MIKQNLYAACQQYVQQRIDTCRAAIQAAQESANSETKSSAGDKYETGRAMAQNERDRNAVQLHEAQKLQAELERIDPAKACDAVRPGALVTTSMGRFYVSISAGQLALDGTDYFAVSPVAPIAAALSGKRAGEEAVFNGRKIRIDAVL